jgi:hypothetical protein
MTDLPEMTARPPAPRKKKGPWGISSAAWLALAIAAVFFAFKAIPKLFYHLVDTEMVVLDMLSHDLLVEHHPFAGWMWGGFTAVFPDLAVFFPLKILHPHGFFALQGTMIFFFFSWLAGCALLVRAFDRPAPSLLTALLWLGVVSVAVGSLDDVALPDSFFQPIAHAGTHTLCLLSTAILFFQIRRGGHLLPFVLIVPIVLATLSDILFLVDFVVPAVATLCLLTVKFPALWRRFAGLAVVIVAAGYLGYKAIEPVSPFPNSGVGVYLSIPWDQLHAQIVLLWNQFLAANPIKWTILVALDGVVVCGLLVAVPILLFKSRDMLLIGGLTFVACAICSDWGAMVLRGVWERMYENRYVSEAMVLPFFLTAFLLHGAIRWPSRLVPSGTFAAAGLIVAAAFLPQPISQSCADARLDIPFLRQVMKENHITAGLADYWKSNLYTDLSHQTVILRSTEWDGRVCKLFQDDAWYGKGEPYAQSPHFRIYWGPGPEVAQNPDYGPPDQVLTAPSGATVWIYSEARAIRYNPYFDILSNKLGENGSTMIFDVSKMLNGTGQVEGKSLVAREGRDKENFLIYGPFLRLQPGRYRVDYGYTYLTPPKKGQEAYYDLNGHDWLGEHISNGRVLPFNGTQHETLTDTFTNSVSDERYEIRIYYHGSGSLKIDSLTVTSLDNLK